jgi:DNA-binding transcriptional LysR family regulator
MKGSRLHLDIFKIFHDLAEMKSFSKAAACNYITQSAVSQQVTFLERHFGKHLIDRGKGRFALTEAGQALQEASRKMLEAYREVSDKLRQSGEISGLVTVESVYSIGLHHLAIYVKTFMRRYPNVNLRVEYHRPDQIYADVLQGICDLGIVACPWRHPLLQVIPFRKERLVVICSPDDPLAGRRQIRFSDLERREFVAFNRGIPTRRAIDELLRAHHVLVNIVQEFDNIETLKRSVEIGAGLSILPDNTIAEEVRNKTLVSLSLAGGPYYRPTGMIYRKDRSLSRAARQFIGWLAKR